MKIKFAPNFTIIFVISASKYIIIRSPRTIELIPFPEVYPRKLTLTSGHYYFVEKLKIVEKQLCKLNCSYGRLSHALKIY